MNAPPQPNVSRLLRRAQRAHESGEPEKAERLYNAVLAQWPQSFEALHGLGQIHERRGRHATALVLFQEALKADPDRADGFASLGRVFHALAQFERALISFEAGLRLAPDDGDLLNRRGVALLQLGRWGEALAGFERVLTRDPAHRDALGNRGNALFKLNRPAEAIEAYDQALALAPDDARLLTNRAIALRRLERPQEALMSAARAIAAAPDFAPARFVEASVRLYLGDFTGWSGYEWRQSGSRGPQCRKLAAPLWVGGEPLAGKTILLHAEQGFGDTIQFARYAPMVAARGARVILEVQPQLVRLLSDLLGVDTVLARGAQLPPIDFHCPLLSLPLAFGTSLDTIPAPIPYIAPSAQDAALRRMNLPQRRPLVGLVWSGESAHDNDVNRSIRLETLVPLFDAADVQWVSLQHDVRERDEELLRERADILQIGQTFSDFADTAAAIAALDAVISVDTAVAHLAGAMGKPLFVLLPFAADFRWLRGRDDSPWYPTARLFRQSQFGEWGRAVERVAGELMRLSENPLSRRRSLPAFAEA